MKKLILGSFALLMFSASMLIFQISCKKSAEAETPVVPLNNKVVFLQYRHNVGTEIWMMNYDGTGKVKVNVALSAGQSINDEVRLSPDGRKLFFIVSSGSNETYKEDLYSCDIDGRNLNKLYDMPAGSGNTILGSVN
ncbi:hypothetical protein SAMN04488128_102533 [Chitinophaga eiseniae]|uniref:WD40-like Beta Propeller Repeat n=1 Tax=Chitinophaga eiseniae TaxID=634771 RepID=A0A1T4QQP8_9BACT|nr:hypothetical protein [Chitinophaga eiseniae]SKA06093.1 hypothetical protein SAMN04488128_102533 [Chitinophaga eiseniae]